MKKILNMLPFLESEDLCELLKECLAGTVDLPIAEILVFMDEDDIDAAFKPFLKNGVLELNENGQKINLNEIMPFLSQNLIDKLFLSKLDGKIESAVLPFVSDEALHKLVLKYAENPDLEMDVDELYPFLSDKDISLLFKTYLKNHKKAPKTEQ